MEPLFYRTVRPMVTFLFKVFYRPKIIGKENIPKDGRVVIAGNHTNLFDCVLLLSSTKRVIHFLAKDSLNKGIVGPIFRGMGIIPVNRKIHDHDALDSAIKALEEEKLIGIFPEGTINRTDDITMPFKFGAVKMSSKTEAPIVPFVITGKYKIFGKSNLKVEFLEPLEIVEVTEYNENLRNTISEKLKQYKEEL